jgi:MFS family permease
MYAFRKPFTVAAFEDLNYWGVDFKIWLITAQVLGYTLSKFIGIKVVSEMSGRNRAKNILLLTLLAAVSLLFFALTPAPYNIVFLFTNGLPLGMIWGLVFSYLEGRRFTEVLGAGLSVSFIFSSGLVKSVGKFLIIEGVSSFWMPFITGMIFFIPMLFFVWMLDRVPPPTAVDEALRTKRKPMNGLERKKFLKNFAPGLILLILTYAMLTAFRDFRDNFAAEIWKSLGYGDSAAIFTASEIPITLGVLLVMGSVVFIKNNRTALYVNHLIVLGGILLVGTSAYLFEQNLINPSTWMILAGFGLYLGYIPFNSIFFDRLIAAFQYVSNVGFVIYLADAFGYLGSVGVMFFKEFGYANMSWLNFFIWGSYILSLAGSVLMIGALIYFQKKSRKNILKTENNLKERDLVMELS